MKHKLKSSAILFAGVVTLALVTFHFGDVEIEHNVNRVEMEINALTIALYIYKEDFGHYPPITSIASSLLGENPKEKIYFEMSPRMVNERKMVVDPWGTPYHFHVRRDDLVITSAGPDRDFSTIADNTSNAEQGAAANP